MHCTHCDSISKSEVITTKFMCMFHQRVATVTVMTALTAAEHRCSIIAARWSPHIPSYNAWLIGPTQVRPPNGILMGSVISVELNHMANIQTHRSCYIKTCGNSPLQAVLQCRMKTRHINSALKHLIKILTVK